MSTNVVLWTSAAPDPLTDTLSAAGYRVWETLVISEVTYLCETENIAVVVVKHDVDFNRASTLAQHVMTIRLEPNASTGELIEVLWQLFPTFEPTIQ